MSGEDPGAVLRIPGYELGERIGKGGMGEVYLARQVALNRQVAIKLMTLDPESDPEKQIERFRREAELMARVSHPNIVSIFDFGVADGHSYLVMEHVEGGDLRLRMPGKRPMGIEQVRNVVRAVIRAITYLHRLGILHRDLKPENILLHHEDNPKVTDFGIAVLHADSSPAHRSNPRAGTLGYVAPEQHYGLKVDERADEYSLAALTYEMLTGYLPLGVFRPPSARNRRLSPEVDAVLMRALEEDRDDRYETITQFGDELDRALATVGARPRRRIALASAASLVALSLLGAAVLLVAGRAAPGHAGIQPQPRPAPAPSAAGESVARTFTNSIGMELVLVPPGSFLMGAADSEKEAGEDERPQHRVRITHPFFMGRREVTVGEFRGFIVATKFEPEAESSGLGGGVYDREKKDIVRDLKWSWSNPGFRGKLFEDHPVVQVSWGDANEFCRWLSRREGRSYRLPTEAEWEYACRAGSTTRWCMGDSLEDLCNYAWFRENSEYAVHRVGRRRPNRFGLFDMHGNVWEWCHDWYGPYSDREVVDPTGPPRGTTRVTRGGPCDWAIEKTRSSARGYLNQFTLYMSNGFRVVCEATDGGAPKRGVQGGKTRLP